MTIKIENGKKVELNEMKKSIDLFPNEVFNERNIFIVAKMKVPKIDAEDDYEIVISHWKREVRKRLDSMGKLQYLNVVT